MRKLTLILTLLLNCVISGQVAVNKSLSDIVRDSDLIIRAKASSINSRWIIENNYKHIYTFADFEVSEVIKGYYSNKKLSLKVIGGTVGDTTEFVLPSFRFNDKEEVILFLNKMNYSPELQILDKIRIVENQVAVNSKFYKAENFTAIIKKNLEGKISLPDEPEELQRIIESIEIKREGIKPIDPKTHLLKSTSLQSSYNLAPYKPSDWSSAIVVSTVSGNNLDAVTIKETDKLYIDWAVANYGPDNVSTSFLVSLYIDNTLQAQWTIDELSASYYIYLSDYQIDPLSSGLHQIKIIVDPTNRILETDETDNEFIKTISVDAVQGLPSITNISPSSASAGTNSIVRITGSNFGAVRGSGKVLFFYKSGEPKIESTNYLSWSDTQIECEVPIGIINDYPASASSGPVTVSTASGTSTGYNFDITFSYGGVKWSGASPLIPLRINENTNDITGEGNEVISAASTWTNAGANFGFYYDGTTTVTDATSDGKNQILWGTTSGSLATAYYWYVGSNLVEADIVFNDSYNWSKDGSQYDVQSIALHELGHWLNLRDLYGGLDADKIMYGISYSGLVKQTLTNSETDGIKYIYGTGSTTLSTPQLTSPANLSTGMSINPLLQWNPVVGTGIVYRVQVSLSNDFTNTITDVSNLTNNQYQLNNLSYYTIYYWRVNATNSSNSTSNWSDTWSFTTLQQTFTVTCNSNPVDGGTTSGCGTYTSGTQVTLNAIPNENYSFLNWTEGQNILSNNPTFNFILISDRIITGNFELSKQLTLTQPNGGESWLVGTSNSIIWTSINITSVKIEHTTDDGNSWNIITNSTPASNGIFNWLIPKINSGSAKIRISDPASQLQDISNNPFNIVGVTRGDVNDDGNVSASDAAMVLKYVVGVESLSTRQQYAADTSLDDLIQAYDAYCILYFVVNGVWP
ncbi:MAG: CARDB domain-containing protein [Melioribacteraceae bacterium]|nr:CARDB domain-containing protein [Melioribacteraceae bacterium]